MPMRLRTAENKLLRLKMAANSIALRHSSRIRDPEQRRLHNMQQRAIAEDLGARPFDASKRPDLFKSLAERSAMNAAYAQLMVPFTYEAPAMRAMASRHFVAFIAQFARPRMSAQDIVNFCREAGALEP